MKTILTLLLCLLPLTASADHWVYIRTYNKPTVCPEQIAQGTYGRSKKGDIVDIRLADYTPSEIEKKEWAIIKVNGLTQEDIQKYRQVWQEQTGVDKKGQPIYKEIADRRYKLDINTLNFKKVGLYPTVVNFSLIKPHIVQKTEADLVSYHRQAKWYALSRPLRKLYAYVKYAYDFWLPPASAAVACADDTTTGEQICTINLATQDYDTLALWEDAKDGDLVTATQQRTAECYDDDGDLGGTCVIDGSITDATYFMKVTSPVAERHSGIAGTGFTYKPGAFEGLTTADPFTLIEWLDVDSSTVNSGRPLFANFGSSTTTKVQNCIFHDEDASDGITDTTGIIVYNTIIYNCPDDGIVISDFQSGKIYNCTIYGNGGDGIDTSANSNNDVRNTISYNNTGDDFNGTGYGASADYNFSKDDTAPEAAGNSIHGDTDGKTPDFVSVTGGSEDFHLQSTSDAIDEGDDLGTDANIDIDNRDRDAENDTWDIGADEYVSAVEERRRMWLGKK